MPQRVYPEVYNLTRTDLHDRKRSYGTLQNAGKFIWSSIFCSDASDSQLRSRLPPEEARVRPSGSSLISLEPNFERTHYCRSSPYFVSRFGITAEACKGLSLRHCIIPHHLLMAMQTTMCKPAFLLSSPFNMMVIDTPQLMELHCRWTSPRSCKEQCSYWFVGLNAATSSESESRCWLFLFAGSRKEGQPCEVWWGQP